jgi:hypothetical protein
MKSLDLKMRRGRLTVAVLLGVMTGLCASAAQATTGPQPLQIQWKQGPDSQQPMITLRNVAQKPIVAYVIRSQYRKPDGSLSFEKARSVVLGLDPAGRQRYAPQESWDDSWRGVSEMTPSVPTLVVDYVLFEDDTAWGPDELKEGARIIGMRQGWRSAYAHMRGILQKQGIEGVQAALASPRK